MFIFSTSHAGQFFRDGVKIDVDAHLHMPGHPPVTCGNSCLKALSVITSSQGAGIVAGTYEDYFNAAPPIVGCLLNQIWKILLHVPFAESDLENTVAC